MVDRPLEGSVALVTGATNGIGLVTAERLAAMGAFVAIAGRRPERLAAAAARVTDAGGRPPETLLADFTRLADVRRLARDFLSRHEALDILVNNAGLINGRREITPDGNEVTFQVDHLAHFLLTHELLPALLAARAARVVTVSSAAHEYAGGIDLGDLTGSRHYRPFAAYAQAKLANVLFAFELARRLGGTGVTSNAVHPGSVRTGFGQGPGMFMLYWNLIRPFLRSPEKGAETQVWMASSPELEGVTGEYFVDCKPRRSSSVSRDATLARLLWEASERLTAVPADTIPPRSPAGADR
jgi:NAD(P)-dependent dehydrogenase (short-subunit alcohol dehydrogenase family)